MKNMKTPFEKQLPPATLALEQQNREKEKFLNRLNDLSKIDSLSGQEEKLREYLMTFFTDLKIKHQVDAKGNLWVESDKPGEQDIMLCAHMDKVGPGTKIKKTAQEIQGRLDDALGMSLILQMYQEGYRPRALFTVEEESQTEIIEDGKPRLINRPLPDNIYNAGARHAADILYDQKQKPKVIIVLDVTGLKKPGQGPAVYTSSGLHRPGKQFPFDPKMLKKIAKIINPLKTGINYIEGNANDAIEFTFVPGIGTIAIEIPIANNHTDKEKANTCDIENALQIIRTLIKKNDLI